MTLLLAALGLLVVTSIVAPLFGRRPQAALSFGMTATVAACVLAAIPAVRMLLEPGVATLTAVESPLGTLYARVDAVSAWFILTISILAAAAAIYSCGYFHGTHEPVGSYAGLFPLLVASLIGVVCAGDCILFLVCWEVMTVSAFFLIGFHDRDPEVRRASWVYIVTTHIGTAFFVMPMFAILWAKTGSTRFEDFPRFAAEGAALAPIVFVLGLAGFGLKAGLMPFHVWLPLAHPAAPAPVSALMSGFVVKTGIYGIVRLLSWMPELPAWCAVTLIAAGAVSGILGVMYALAQHDLKRLLAYHTVENIGIIVLGLGVALLGRSTHNAVLEAAGFAGALLHTLNHALFKGLLFLSAGGVIHATGTAAIDRLGGLSRAGRLHAILFLVGALSICGLPPFNGFVSEWLIYGASAGGALEGGSAAAAVGFVSLAVMGGLALACFAKAFGAIFLGEPRDRRVPAHAVPASMLAPMAALALLCAAIGLGSGPVIDAVLRAASVLGAAGPIDPYLPPIPLMQSAALLVGVVLVLLALRTMLGKPAAAPVPTWGCGYAAPSARMQYTATAFAWFLVSSTRAAIGAERHLSPPEGVLPAAPGTAESHTPDTWLERIFAPLFGLIRHLCTMIQTFSWSGQPTDPARHPGAFRRLVDAVRRRGIHISLTYIILVLVALFLIEAFRAPATREPAAVERPGGNP